MATKKVSGKTPGAVSAKKTTAKKAIAKPEAVMRSAPAVGRKSDAAPAQRVSVGKAPGPTARTCPLVLDGEVAASDFSPADCFSCSEFDCRFCRAEEGSGTLRSRLFAASDEDDGGDEGWGGDPDIGEADDAKGEDADEGEEDPLPADD